VGKLKTGFGVGKRATGTRYDYMITKHGHKHQTAAIFNDLNSVIKVFFYCQLMNKIIVFKGVLKFTLKLQ